ncbi:MAG: hypothetical protein Kow00120_23120 [Anaerolineae bacterium]
MLSETFRDAIIPIYFVYGLGFFSLGLAVALESRRSAPDLPFARAMIPLAIFGLIQGVHVWLEMFVRDAELHGSAAPPPWFELLRLALLAASFAALIAFGVKMLRPSGWPTHTEWYIAGVMVLFWLGSVMVLGQLLRPGDAMRTTLESWFRMTDTLSRYVLAIPGALISGYALWRQAGRLVQERRRFTRDLRVASITFFVYGLVGQLFVNETRLFPSNIINADVFMQLTGAPIQLFRGALAVVLAVTLIRAMQLFELDRRRALAAAEQRAHDELAKREALRREMLRHTVAAQEEERRRIARELHDEIGQILTGLSLGLAGLQQSAGADANGLTEQISELRQLTQDSVTELRQLVTDLRPSQLDHLGLVAAVRALVQESRQRFGLKVDFEVTGPRRRLPPEVELAVFRIAQESLTNVARHAGAPEARVRLAYEADGVRIAVSDKGVGFTYQEHEFANGQHWGLLGITERAAQWGGTVTIDTAPGAGTRVEAWLPVKPETAG